ncbi:hypothetical protein QTI66_31985 [Variovorax sp. J22R133]|uniref:hypothetical protein n=1 Tax=Variovorax brevis TaxID=3053503 RepID=UPI002575674F|nr:hypothetical protein [Variovorax sp. J22R133]MDM0116757.1 hypothetical protein [Variovorax sp. J22R133]
MQDPTASTFPYDLSFELPHELHEWVEIQVGEVGGIHWVGGLRSPDGERRVVYEQAHIKNLSSREEAMQVGQKIASMASMQRLILSLTPTRCSFREVGEDE